MFETYTESARRVIFFARYEASQLGQVTIKPEHLLLAIIRQNSDMIGSLLHDDPTAEKLKTTIHERVETLEKRINANSVDLPLSDESKGVLKRAVLIVQESRHKYVHPEHLLMAILKEEKSLASEILSQHGISVDLVRGHWSAVMRKR